MTAYCISIQHQREAEWLIDVFMISRWHFPPLGISFWPTLYGAESRRMSCGWMGLWSNVRVTGDFVVLEVSIVEKLCRGCVLGWKREPLVVLKQGHAICSGGLKHFLERHLLACCWTEMVREPLTCNIKWAHGVWHFPLEARSYCIIQWEWAIWGQVKQAGGSIGGHEVKLMFLASTVLSLPPTSDNLRKSSR